MIHLADSIKAYEDRLREIEREVERLEFDLDMSDRIVEMREHPGWQTIAKRLSEFRSDTVGRLLRNEMAGYRQGWYQGRLSIIDTMLNQSPMTADEIGAVRDRIAMLNDKAMEIREVLR